MQRRNFLDISRGEWLGGPGEPTRQDTDGRIGEQPIRLNGLNEETRASAQKIIDSPVGDFGGDPDLLTFSPISSYFVYSSKSI